MLAAFRSERSSRSLGLRRESNRQNGAPRIDNPGVRHRAAITEVAMSRWTGRGTPRTCFLVADKFGFANSQTVAPPALGDTQSGCAMSDCCRTILPSISSQSAKAATPHRLRCDREVQAIERRIATATPPNRLTTQRRLLQRAGGDAWDAAMKGSGSKANLSSRRTRTTSLP